MNQYEVTKHSAIIQMENRITLFQRRGWNILLAKAFHELRNKPVHEMRFTEFCEMMGYQHTDKKYSEIEELLYELTGIGIRWNYLGKDKHEKERGGVRLLAGFKIVDGMMQWDYSTFLREKLSDPRIFARINLTIQNRFRSKHSLALYELFVDYKGVSQTPWISIEDFRGLMGIKDDEYTRYKDLKYYVINRSLRDINKESDMNVVLDTKRKSRKVAELKFHIRENRGFQPSFDIPSPPAPEELKELEDHSSNEVNQELLDRLIQFGVPKRKAIRELKKDEQRVSMALDAAIAYIEKQGDNIHNLAGVVNKAITDGWGVKSPVEIEKEEKKQALIKARTEKEKEEKALEEIKSRFDEHRKREALGIFNGLAEQQKEHVLKEVEQRVPKIMKQFFKKSGIESPFVMIGTFIPYMSEQYFSEDLQDFDKWVKNVHR